MTAYSSDLTSGKTCTASSSNADAPKAIDNTSAYWKSVINQVIGEWLKVDFVDAVFIEKVTLKSQQSSQGYKNFKVQGSNDDSQWTDIYSGLSAYIDTVQSFEFDNSESYRYYRIYCVDGQSLSYLTIEEIEMMNSLIVVLDSSATMKWLEYETIDSISIGAKTFKCQLENTDNSITESYDAFDTAVIYVDDTIVFNGRIEEIIPNESEATIELAGKDYMGDLIGEYIIENYGISQDMSNNEAAGSDVVIEITDTTGFEVDDEIKVEDDNDAETSVITAVVANTSITVDTLANSYTTAANAKVTVGRLGSYIVNDLVEKYGASMTRVGIQTSDNKFIILFKGITAFDAIQYIADSEEFEFGQDQTKDFFYQPRTFEDSGLSIDLDSDDVMEYSFPRPGYEIINRVDIYGGTSGGVQVAIRVEDPTSQNYYGIIKGMTIIDEKITTELQAQARANAILSEKAWVIQIGELSVVGYETLQAGQLISLSNFDSIDDGPYLVTEKMHLEPPGDTLIKVAEYRAELEDVIIDLLKRMRAREKEAMDEDAFQTKFLNFYVTYLNTDVIVNVIQVDINDGYIAAHKTNSLVGRGYDGVGGNQLKAGRYQTETVIV